MALSIDGIAKIRITLNLLLKYNKIEWQGSLYNTYKKYLWPNVLETTEDIWANIASNKITSLWQLNTSVGKQALEKVQANSIKEIGMINSLMRLQPQKGQEQPLDIFVKFRNDIELWYEQMRDFGLNESEIKTLEPHLLPLYGVADTQEAVMQLSMDPAIAGFNVVEANALRKGIA